MAEEKKMMLTQANIRYLLAIEALDRDDSGVRCVDVAQALGITKPSVHSMMNTLKQMSLLEKSHYGMIHLTDKGKQVAQRYQGWFQSISHHFQPLLTSEQDVNLVACALMAELPEGSMQAMCEKMDQIEVSQTCLVQ